MAAFSLALDDAEAESEAQAAQAAAEREAAAAARNVQGARERAAESARVLARVNPLVRAAASGGVRGEG